ncbi:cache domain-containing sensor histidine kinase [Halalkalibacter urbisdiaboli]|uniref:cache domain-containing sensor histidine kinase n=1 Tax=Halalkalibacter urbisdiaboli TaxID=1960589 RepID=UPI000B4397B4|nr:sensor histidine kinase [Halalkalibacter urbisdiaboli]
MFRKLTTIMVISFVMVNGLFLSGLSFVSYKYFFNFTSEEISEARLTLLNESAKKLSGFITSVSEAGMYIAINRNVIQMFSDEPASSYEAIAEQRELTQLVNGVTSLKTYIHSIDIYTDRYENYPKIPGKIVQSKENIENERWFKQLFNKMDDGWVPKHQSAFSNQEFISYVHRILNQRGQTVGYIKVNVLAETFFDYMSNKELLKESDEPLILLNTGRKIIAQTHSPESFQVLDEITISAPSEPYMMLTETYNQYSNHHELIKHENEFFLLLISEPNYEQWSLVQLIPVDPLYQETRKIGFTILLMGLLGLVLSVPIVYWVGKRFTGPISKLITGMKYVEKGRFDKKVGPYYIEEYDTLANNFNHMTNQLNETLNNLKKENGFRREAEIRALQSQIMPHFLYNTLDMIRWKAMDHRADDISHMVNQLSRMLRISLSGGRQFILLRDELEHAKSYVDIQRARLKEEFIYEVKIPASLKDLYVPKIILQPFIENSMKHGYIDLSKKVVRIIIFAKIVKETNNDCLEITVTDFGCGLPENWNLHDSKGIGIKNVQERIWMYCGHPYGIKLFNHQDGGTAVRIVLPIIKEQAELDVWIKKQHKWFDGTKGEGQS